jgi:hypothetical protein
VRYASACSVLRGQRPWHVQKLFVWEPGDLWVGRREAVRVGKAASQSKPMMHDPQKSDRCIVAMKSANEPEGTGSESMERRRRAEGNVLKPCTHRTQRRACVFPGLERVRARAKAQKKERFTALLHHVNVDRLREAYFALKREAAPGVDGVTWQQYGEGLEAKLTELHERIHCGAYRALPSRRQYIPKSDGRLRPLGIASLSITAPGHRLEGIHKHT